MNTDILNIVMIIALTACMYMLFTEIKEIQKDVTDIQRYIITQTNETVTCDKQPSQEPLIIEELPSESIEEVKEIYKTLPNVSTTET